MEQVQAAAGQLIITDAEDMDEVDVFDAAAKLYAEAHALGITRTRTAWDDLPPRFQMRWALLVERGTPLLS